MESDFLVLENEAGCTIEGIFSVYDRQRFLKAGWKILQEGRL